MQKQLFNAEMETLSAAAELRLQQVRLRRQMPYVFARSPMLRRKFEAVGMTADDIRRPEDLQRLPFTTKAELRESQEQVPPLGDFLAAEMDAVQRVHRTSGATGKFVYTALTANDLRLTHDCGARAFWAAGLRPHHRVVHCLNYALWMGGYTDHANLETTGAAVFPFGVGNSRQLVRVIRQAGIDAISSTPSYPKTLEAVVRAELGIEPQELGLKLGLFGGEPGLDNPVYRQRIEATWGLRAQNANYGVSDVLCNFAAVCEDNYHLHFLGQGALLVQLIDPFSGEDIALEAGATGEMVLTHLEKEAQPLVRYRTADIIEILETGACRCGRTGFRFKVVGRSDNMLPVRGINVFPNGIARVLEEMVPRVTGEFQVILDHPPPYSHLNIDVEHGADLPAQEMPAAQQALADAIKDRLNVGTRIRLVAPGSIQRTAMGKAIRVMHRY